MNEPLFSIVIPTYNRPERLQRCLQAISRLDYPRQKFELILVDDGSETPLDSVVAPFQDQFNLTLIRQVNAGPAAARNTGAKHAKGEFLAFTDDDCTPTPNWLTALETCFTAAPDSLVGGRTLNALPNNLYSTASQLLIDYLYAYYNRTVGQATFFASNNFAMPTQRFRTIGGFNTSFPLAAGEDREFCDRWLQYRYPMTYAPEVQISHAHHLTWRSFWRQHFNYGRGAFCFHQIRAQRIQTQIKVEPVTFYFNLLAYPFRQSHSQSALLLTLLLFLSQVANAAGFFRERLSQPVEQQIKLT